VLGSPAHSEETAAVQVGVAKTRKIAIVELANRRWNTVRAKATLPCLRPLPCGMN
jgi:hypothetical protein